MTEDLRTALVAEDNAALRRVIGVTLKNSGFDVLSACDGAEAWELAQEQDLDLIVTDQQMPRMTGLEFVERLRESVRNSATPVILLTAKGYELQSETLREEYGVAALLTKPFSPSQLSLVASQLASSPA